MVGLSNTVISYAFYYGLKAIGFHYVLAFSIGFIISVLNAYFWSSRFVFGKGHANSVVRIFASYGVTLVISNLLLIVLVDYLGVSMEFGPILLLFFTVPANYLLNKFWVFK